MRRSNGYVNDCETFLIFLLLSDIILLIILILVAIIDARYFVIPDQLSFTVIGLVSIQIPFLDNYTIFDRLLGGFIALVVFEFTRRIMTLHLKRDALGMGDVKLMVGGGLWVGLSYLPIATLIACVTGLLHFLVIPIFYKTSNRVQRIPFGPYLVLGLLSTKMPITQNILSMLTPI